MLMLFKMLQRFFLLLLFLFTFISVLHCQPQDKPLPSKTDFIFVETNYFISDTGFTCYISYRIPYSNLIFVKNGNGFTGGLTLDFELRNNGKIVNRKSATKNVVVESYSSTISESEYLQGVASLELSNTDYTLNMFVSLKNGSSSTPLDSISLKRESFVKNIFLKPIVVEEDNSDCAKSFPYQLTNFESTIPFSYKSAALLITVKDTSIQNVDVKITQKTGTTIERNASSVYTGVLALQDCDGKIVLYKTDSNLKLKYFLLDNFKQNLKEGPITISLSANQSSADFELNVLWNDKPKSRSIPELAIKILEAIESEAVIDTLLSNDKEEYDKVLTEYWNKKYPGKNGSFNDIEAEYYHRADYAIEKFTTVANKNGAKSDRGITYIRYGEPDEIKRDYNDSNMAIEIWNYKRINKQFIFTDKTGLGNFELDK
jgi:GWxTD domain-containing protein